jgi:hypothetical protein
MNWLKQIFLRWLLADVEARLIDLEKHFVTKRNEKGEPIETLADVPLSDRAARRQKLAGMSMQQRLKWLERTDGGTRVPHVQRVDSSQMVGSKVNG